MTDVQSNEVPFDVLGDDVSPPHVGLEVEVYAHDDPNRRIDVIPFRWDVTCLDEIGKPGGGSFEMWRHDPKFVDSPSLLNWRNIVKVKVNHQVVGGFLIQNKKTDFVTRDEVSSEVWKVTGEGLRSWFRDAVVLPYGGLKAKSAGQRVFSFASERGTWYKPSQWKTPIKIQQHNLDPNPGPWGTAPAQWPDAPNAWWVWGVNNNQTTPAPEGYNFFRYEFDIPESVGTKKYAVFAAGDNQMVAYVDAQEVITADTDDSWTKTWRADFELDPGHHILAFRVLNSAISPAALIAAFYRAGDAAAETAAELLSVTGDPGWLVNAYPSPAPGWTAGEIMLTLLAEADARGVSFPDFLTPTFTAEHDTHGAAWSRALDWNFGVGTEYFEVIERLEEAVCDLWVDPSDYTLNMYVQRGVDRSQQSVATTPIKFEIGKNVTRAREEGVSDIKNTLTLSTTDGWYLQSDALTGSIPTYGRIEGSLSTGLSPDVSGDVARSVFDQKAIPRMASTFDIIDTEDARPLVDFQVGDYVLAPTVNDTLTPIRILSISVAENRKTGQPVYALEFGTISDDLATRHERWLKTIQNAALGGSVANVGGGGSGSSANPAQATSDGPMGPQGPAGPRGMTYRGVWQSSIAYKALDAVSHEGSSWISNVSQNTDSEPEDGNTDWTLLAAAGEEGDSAYEVAVANGYVGTEEEWLESLVGPPGPAGAGVTYKGAWSDTAEYVAGDLVSHEDAFWIANDYNLDAEPGTDPVWDSYDTSGGGLPPVATPDIVYGTDAAGAQTTYPLAGAPSPGSVPRRTAQSALRAQTTADGATGDSLDVLVNKGYFAKFRGDNVTNVTLVNAGSTATTDTQDVIFFSGPTVATYAVTLPTGLTSFKRITLAFLAEVTALTLNAGAGNTVNVAPTTAPVNTVLAYEYDPALTKWILVSQYPVGSGAGGGADTSAMHYRGAWSPSLAYAKNDVVLVGTDRYIANNDIAAGGGSATTQYIGGTVATGNSSADTITLPAGTLAGDVLVLALVATSNPSVIAGWTVLGSQPTSGNARLTIMTRSHDGGAAPTLPSIGDHHQWILRTYRNVATPVLLDIQSGMVAPAKTGLTHAFVERIFGTNDSGTYSTAATLVNQQIPAHSYLGQMQGDQNVVAGAVPAVTFLINGTSSVSPTSTATLGMSILASFVPGVNWTLLAVTDLPAMVFKGTWSSASAYDIDDVVVVGDRAYVATTAHAVGLPQSGFDPAGWQPLAPAAGGASDGFGIAASTVKGAWSSATAYVKDDVVLQGGSTYAALAPSTNQDPVTSPASWVLLASGGVGSQGPPGPAGPMGPEGPQGEKGDTGDTGLTGADGPAGAKGEVGPQGPPGPAGAEGPEGPAGEDSTVPGPEGPAGPQGDPGPAGPAGADGAEGPAGADGVAGPEGPTGPKGDQGDIGPQGPVGPEGPQGEDGLAGPKGDQGDPGPAGPAGPAGPVDGAYRGVWDSGTSYVAGDTVLHNDVLYAKVSGLPVTTVATNQITNPSFEVGTTGWTTTSMAAWGKTSEWASSGTSSLKGVTTGASTSNTGDFRLTGGGGASMPGGLVAGHTYTVSVDMLTPAAHTSFTPGTRQRRILWFYSMDGTSNYTQDFGPQGANATGVQRLTHTFTIPPGATGGQLAVSGAGSPTDNSFISYIDRVQIEEGSVATPFFDGSTPATSSAPGVPAYTYAWLGTPHLSASVKRAQDEWVRIANKNPAGGNTAYVLTKNSPADFDYSWKASAGGGGGGGATHEVLVLSSTTGQFDEQMGTVYSIDRTTFTTVTMPKARIRIYRTSAGRAADLTRLATTAYPGGRALVYEYIATASGEIDYEEPVLAGGVPGDETMYFVIDGSAQVTIDWTKIGSP